MKTSVLRMGSCNSKVNYVWHGDNTILTWFVLVVAIDDDDGDVGVHMRVRVLTINVI